MNDIKKELTSILPNLDSAANLLIEVSKKLEQLQLEKTCNELNKVIIDLLATKQTIITYHT